MIITSEKFPNIIKAMHCIQDDTQGAGFIKPPIFDVPDRWSPYLENINTTLGRLSQTERAPESEPLAPHIKPNPYLDSEFYTFCNGEYFEMAALVNRDIHHAEASLFLNDFFEDWSLTGDDPKNEPGNKVRQARLEWLETMREESGFEPTAEMQAEYDSLKMALV